MTTTVVLTTYNGMKYIEPLLDSLRLQTQRIDEVLIFDDGSTDKTIEFIQNYIKRYELNGWSATVNKVNKGWKKNFKDAILSATSDLIFPCDQDDIWEYDKIKKMCRIFEENFDVMLLSSIYKPLYEEDGHKVDTFQNYSETPQFVCDDEKFSVHTRPGCVMCVRKAFVMEIAEIWDDNYAHDALLWTAATLSGGNFLLNLPLIQYRRHSNNASTGAHRTIENQVLLMEMGKKIAQWYKSCHNHIPENKNKIIVEYLEWADLRIELLQSGKLNNFFRLLKYHKYFRSVRQELGDLYYLMRRR